MGGTSDRLTWILVVLAEVALLRSIHLRSRVVPAFRSLFPIITCALVNDLATRGLEALLARAPETSRHPFSGIYRALYHVDSAFTLGWPFVVAAFALCSFLPGRRRAALDVLLGTWMGLVIGTMGLYPLRGRTLVRLHLGVELAACAIVAACAAWTWSRSRWGAIHTIALLLAGGELVIAVVGPYATDPFESWEVARVIYFIEFAGLAYWLGRDR